MRHENGPAPAFRATRPCGQPFDAVSGRPYRRRVRVFPRIQAAARRHRRGLAAVLAGLAMLMAINAVRPGPEQPGTTLGSAGPPVRPGEVAVPVALASPALAAAVEPGDVVDVIAVPDDPGGSARVLADHARVLDLPGSGGFTTSSSSVVLLAVPETAALPLSAAVGQVLTLVIRAG